MTTISALSGVVTPPFTSSVQRTLGSRVFEEYVSVKDFGAVGDNSTDDTAAIQAAIDYCFGTTASPHGLSSYTNMALYFPPGRYKTTTTLTLTKVHSGRIMGAGRFVSRIINATTNPIFITNGFEYSRVESLSLESAAGSHNVFQLSWDNLSGAALQSNTFLDMNFDGGGVGLNLGAIFGALPTPYMGSENLVINCSFSNQSACGLRTSGSNALQNSVIGCSFDTCVIGIYIRLGSAPLIEGCNFSGNTAWDIQQDNSARDSVAIIGCYTTSANFATIGNTLMGTIDGCTQITSTSGTFVAMASIGGYSIRGCNSQNGKVTFGGSVRASISQCTFGRNDWITFSGSNPDLAVEIEGVQYNESATPAQIARQRKTSSGSPSYTTITQNYSVS